MSPIRTFNHDLALDQLRKGKSVSEVAREFDVWPSFIQRLAIAYKIDPIKSKPGKMRFDHERALKLLEDGVDIKTVADRFEITPNSVRLLARRHNIEAKNDVKIMAPKWVPLELVPKYMRIASVEDEMAAASWARKMKRGMLHERT